MIRLYFYNNGTWHYLQYLSGGTIAGTPAGNDTEIQFNSGGLFGATSSFRLISSSNLQLNQGSFFINTASDGGNNLGQTTFQVMSKGGGNSTDSIFIVKDTASLNGGIRGTS